MGQLSLATYRTAPIKYLKLSSKNFGDLIIDLTLMKIEFNFARAIYNKVKNGLTRVHYLLSLVSIDTKLYNSAQRFIVMKS